MSSARVVESPSTLPSTDQTSKRSPRRRLSVALALVAVLASVAFGSYWWSENKYDYIAKRWGVVVPGKIFRSGQQTPQMLDKLVKEHGIAALVDMQLNDIHDVKQQAEVQYAAEHGISHYRYGLGGDGTGKVSSYVGAVARLIQCVRDNQPVLVHCAAGTQRTGGVAACYRLLVEHADPQDVYNELKEYEWNHEEDFELVDYLNRHLPEIAQGLHEEGFLDEMPATFPHLGE